MAENQGVWGIEIGQAGLKAIRLRYAEAAHQVLAVAFDYVPHPKILSQPDAIPEELIPQALEKFLSRNDIRNDAIAISVPGQAALTRFIQLPPVQAAKVADIVKYEARQQIPFALEDVIWDYQVLSGGTADSDFMVDAEVGLFAMKREQVMQHLRPFTNAKLEVELIQVAPLALYNVLSYDLLGIRPDDEVAARDEYTILLDMGADNTTLLVSNGAKIWIRNVPIGGNHFTRALTKEMKLTFAKAEHLKCNATKSPDPRAVFQALRPVFNDYVSEIQRSIGYFSSVNRNAKIAKVVGVGNGFKLAGLQKFLQQNLQYPVERLDRFQALAGDTVLSAPLFEENILSFAVPYGLALQQLEQTRIHTTLLPPEIATARKIRKKKPWAVAAAATLLFALTLSAVGYSSVYRSVGDDRWKDAEAAVEAVNGKASSFQSSYSTKTGEYKTIEDSAAGLTRPVDTRTQWLALYRAINAALPQDEQGLDQADITKRNQIRLMSITAKKEADLSTYLDTVPENYKDYLRAADKDNPPSGEGYVFTLRGQHFHNDPNDPEGGWGPLYVKKTLLEDGLHQWMSDDGVPIRGVGISHAALVNEYTREIPYDPEAARWNPMLAAGRQGGSGMYPGMGMGMYPGAGGYDGGEMPYDSMMESYGSGYGGAGAGLPGMTMPGMGGFGGGHGAGGFGGAPALPRIDVKSLLNTPGEQQQQQRKPTQMIKQTNFIVKFVWTPLPDEKREALQAIHEVVQRNPQATVTDVQEYVKQVAERNGQMPIAVTQEDFDEYQKLNAPAAPAGEAPAT